jgi:hypothetical protein
LVFFNGKTSKFSSVVSQVLAYAQQSRESSNYEQESLSERMRDYKRQIDRQSRQSLNVYHGASNGDGMQPFTRTSHKVIDSVMQSTAQGKVFSDMCLLLVFYMLLYSLFCISIDYS